MIRGAMYSMQVSYNFFNMRDIKFEPGTRLARPHPQYYVCSTVQLEMA